ncbi:MAG: hypothetical protein ABW186_14480 [Rhodanobacteraceae bacterium]
MKTRSHCRLSARSFCALHASRVALAVLVCAGWNAAGAATLCVTNGDVAGLQSALATAAGNGEDDLIELQQGQYPMPSNFVLSYQAVTEHHDITIEGGYSASFGNDCATPPASPDARNTVLDGGLWRLHLAPGVGSLKLKSVTLQSTFSVDAAHAPIEIGADINSTGNIAIENVIFLNNGSSTAPAVYLLAGSAAVFVQNSLFAGNVTFGQSNAVLIGSRRLSAFGDLIVNSTFSGNASSLPALDVYTPNSSAIVANDILWGNTGGDVVFSNPPSSYVLNDDFGDLLEAGGTQSANLVSVDPLFKPDFSLDDLSPLRDKGNTGSAIFSPGLFDVAGLPRVYHNEKPDIGAFEIQDVIFASGVDFN